MNLEVNKIFAALLVAGIVASSTGFITEQLMPEAEAGHDDGAAEPEEAGGAGESKVVKPQLPAPVLALIAGADIERGKKLSRSCAGCHNFDKGGVSGHGPNLWGILGRGKAGKDGYSYSPAMAELKGQKWSYAELNKFLWKPKKAVPGTKMNYIGLKKPEDRAAIIAWLRSLSDSPAALPSAAAIAAEEEELEVEESEGTEEVSEEH